MHAMSCSEGEQRSSALLSATEPKQQVRCDGRPDCCRNCERLRFDCSFQPKEAVTSGDSPSGDQSLVQLERRRGVRACTECRSQKIKCGGEAPACSNCLRRNRACTYPTLKRPHRTPQSSSLPSPSVSQRSENQQQLPSPFEQATNEPDHNRPSYMGDFPSQPEILSLIEAYFEHIYALPWYAFLHKRSVIQRCREGKIEDCLVFAICAVTAQRLKVEPYARELSAKWAQNAEDILLQYMESPSTSRLQALILVVRYRVEVGHFSRAFMLAALAGRSAVALRLKLRAARAALPGARSPSALDVVMFCSGRQFFRRSAGVRDVFA